jgi:hypothetical protein
VRIVDRMRLPINEDRDGIVLHDVGGLVHVIYDYLRLRFIKSFCR